MPKLKLDWTDLCLLVGYACSLAAAFLLWGLAIALLAFGLSLMAIAALADLWILRR